MKKLTKAHITNANRIFYINEEGELFVQFRSNKQDELGVIAMRANEFGETIYYTEELVSGHSISGYVTRVTKSGVALKDWSIK